MCGVVGWFRDGSGLDGDGLIIIWSLVVGDLGWVEEERWEEGKKGGSYGYCTMYFTK